MGPSVERGAIVTARFPYSDLTDWPVRPVVVLARAGPQDWVLGQVTSNPYADSLAIELTNDALDQGILRLVSYFRPNKLFTGNEALIITPIARLKPEVFNRLLDATMDILDRNRIRQ